MGLSQLRIAQSVLGKKEVEENKGRKEKKEEEDIKEEEDAWEKEEEETPVRHQQQKGETKDELRENGKERVEGKW